LTGPWYHKAIREPIGKAQQHTSAKPGTVTAGRARMSARLPQDSRGSSPPGSRRCHAGCWGMVGALSLLHLTALQTSTGGQRRCAERGAVGGERLLPWAVTRLLLASFGLSSSGGGRGTGEHPEQSWHTGGGWSAGRRGCRSWAAPGLGRLGDAGAATSGHGRQVAKDSAGCSWQLGSEGQQPQTGALGRSAGH